MKFEVLFSVPPRIQQAFSHSLAPIYVWYFNPHRPPPAPPPSPSYSTLPHLTLLHSIVYSCRLRPFSSSAHRDCNLSVGYVNSFKSNLKTALFQTPSHFFFKCQGISFSNLKTVLFQTSRHFFLNLKTFLFRTSRQLFLKPQDSSFFQDSRTCFPFRDAVLHRLRFLLAV